MPSNLNYKLGKQSLCHKLSVQSSLLASWRHSFEGLIVFGYLVDNFLLRIYRIHREQPSIRMTARLKWKKGVWKWANLKETSSCVHERTSSLGWPGKEPTWLPCPRTFCPEQMLIPDQEQSLSEAVIAPGSWSYIVQLPARRVLEKIPLNSHHQDQARATA
eukprot:1137807-Pelagomonas_calceolata.AAC.1